MMTSADANDDDSYDVTIYDVIDDDDVANVSFLNSSNWLKAATVTAAAVAILVILLLSTHRLMLLI